MPRWDPADQPEHQVRLDNIEDVLTLNERAVRAGVPAEVAAKLPLFVAARQAGRPSGLSVRTEIRLRAVLAELEEEQLPPPEPGTVSRAVRRSRKVKRRNPGYRNWPGMARGASAAA